MDNVGKNMLIRKILKEEFVKLKELFPGNEELWKKYKKQRLKQKVLAELTLLLSLWQLPLKWRLKMQD